MTTQAIDTPVLSGSALRSINFFNGRLLTGDDLSSEQAAQLARAQRLGRAVGEGVAFGLEVSAQAGSQPDQPVVTVAAGVALSRSGLALELPSAVDVSIARALATPGSEPGGLFADCQPYAPGTYTAGAGIYLLTICPAQEGDGLAPVNGLGNASSPCNVATEIQTVKFHLIRLALTAAELSDTQKLRNHVAYLCFAPDVLAGFTAGPFGAPPTTYGLIDELRDQTISDDEVPLALIGWTADTGIDFVDLWSVRRRITRRPPEGDFAAFAGDRRKAEGEAMFLQFQGHVQDLARAPQTPRALDAFRYLPPAGLLPLHTSTSLTGLDLVAFLDGLISHESVFLEGARLGYMIRASFEFPPVDLDTGEPIRVYLVRENRFIAAGTGPAPQPYAVITSGHGPYCGDARYDLAFWDYANYAER